MGILIAFQITEWNDEREERLRTERLFERLEVDFGIDAWLADSFYAYHQTVLKNGKFAIDDLNGKKRLSDHELLIAAFRATQFNRINPTNSTYQELVATGGIDLVGDSELGRLASLFYESDIPDEIMGAGQNSEYRRLFRTIVPIDVQLAIAEACGDRFVTIDIMMASISLLSYECEVNLPEEEMTYAAAILRENSMLADYLQHRLAELSQQIDDFMTFREFTKPYRATREELEASPFMSVFLEMN